jgi:chromosome segregation ATPase
MSKLRGMRDVATLQRQSRPNTGLSRQQIANKIARLEHDRLRLQREAQTWRTNLVKTETRLAHTETQLSQLHAQLGPTTTNTRPAAPAPQGFGTLDLEY